MIQRHAHVLGVDQAALQVRPGVVGDEEVDDEDAQGRGHRRRDQSEEPFRVVGDPDVLFELFDRARRDGRFFDGTRLDRL